MAEHCFNCVYSFWDRAQMVWNLAHRVITHPTCGNQPDHPGHIRRCPLGPVCRNYRRRPPKPEGNNVKTIPVGGDFHAYVDAADFEWLNRWVWYLHGEYAARWERGKIIFLHREVARPPKGMVVDSRTATNWTTRGRTCGSARSRRTPAIEARSAAVRRDSRA